jgi:hypothetical protein
MTKMTATDVAAASGAVFGAMRTVMGAIHHAC